MNIAERVQASIRAVNAAERDAVVAGSFTLYRSRASDHPYLNFAVPNAGSAQWEGIGALRGAFAALRAKRQVWRIAGIDWFTWRDQLAPDVHCGFCQGAGLFDLAGQAKPAWYAYKAAVRANVR